MAWARASAIDRLMECPGPALLPASPEEKSPKAVEAAAWGTMAHRWKATGEIVAEPGWKKHEKHFAAKLAACGMPTQADQDRFREMWWPSSGQHEIAVAINCGGGSQSVAWYEGGGADADWKARWSDPWVTGTLDYVGEVLGDPWVDDLKTGSWPPTGPDLSQQIRVYGLARWLIGSAKQTPDRLVLSITHWPRYPVIGLPTRTWHEETPQGVADFERRLKLRYALVRRLREAGDERRVAELIPGEWCRFCPAGGNCPRVNEN